MTKYFLISRHTIATNRNKVAPIFSPCSMLFWTNSQSLRVWCCRKQHWKKEGGRSVIRELKQRGRQNNGLDWQSNNFARASRFFVHFFAVTVQLRRESSLFHVLRRCCTGRFETTIFSATQRCNFGTMLQAFKTMSQQCCNAVLC